MTIKPIANQSASENLAQDQSGQRRNSNKCNNRSSKRETKRDKTATQTKYQTSTSKAAGTQQQLQIPCTSAEQQKSIEEITEHSSNNEASNKCVNAEKVADLIEKFEKSGYNSGDEHLSPKDNSLTSEEWKKRDEKFSKVLAENGLELIPMEEDGACLFRAISYQLYGDQEMHDIIRQQTCDYIYQNREYFAHFITEDITLYVNRKRQLHLHGNHIEIQAMSEMYNRAVELYCYEMAPINIYNSEQINNGYQPLRLSYHRYSHYNAIIDPFHGSVGVGLGLAGYPENFNDQKQAEKLSEEMEIEKMMVEDKLKNSDWEATSDVVVEQIARQSYLQFCHENNNKKLKAIKSATVTSEASCSSSATSSGQSTSSCEIEKNNVPYIERRRSKKRNYHHLKQDESTSPKRLKRLTPSPSSGSSPSYPASPSSPTSAEKPLSEFYRDLLESSYEGFNQLSEKEMMQKALMKSIQEIAMQRTNNGESEED